MVDLDRCGKIILCLNLSGREDSSTKKKKMLGKLIPFYFLRTGKDSRKGTWFSFQGLGSSVKSTTCPASTQVAEVLVTSRV